MIQAIAIDGPAASGKTAIGKELAKSLGFVFLDTGLMYRAITFWALEENIDLNDLRALGELAQSKAKDAGEFALLGGSEILHSHAVGRHVSIVSRESVVREPLVKQQRIIAELGPIVMVGRDIGTIVLPSALKIFLEASQEVRTKRRLNELLEKGRIETSSSAGQEIEFRDELDSQREISPLIAAPDAIKINTEEIGIAEVVLLINKAIDDT
tara:strand:- start:1761 stop:2396 length:636 start_codon:yes stop_codon:yes gene_type:complete